MTHLMATREQFEMYDRLFKNGKYNMLTSSVELSRTIGVSMNTYLDMVYNYNSYNRVYSNHNIH